MSIDEEAELPRDFSVFRCAVEEAAVWRSLENVQIRRDVRGTQRAVHADRVGQKEITGSAGKEGRREARRDVTEERQKVRMGEVMTVGVQQVRRHEQAQQIDAEVRREGIAGLGQVELG